MDLISIAYVHALNKQINIKFCSNTLESKMAYKMATILQNVNVYYTKYKKY